jgi:arginyl-tRNA synthetase
MKQLVNLISEVIKDIYNIERSVEFNRPQNDFGDYASNIAMQISKDLGKNPRDIAEEIVNKIIDNELISEATVAGPGFINIKVSARNLEIDLTNQWNSKYGSNNEGNGKTVVVEYPSPNMAKPYSVGHLRPGNQGWAAKRLMEETGWKVITDNHLGDYGAPFGIWVVGYLKLSSPEQLARDGVYELGRVYIEMKALLEAEKNEGKSTLADEVQQWLLKLEAGDTEAKDYSDKFNKISLDHIHAMMNRLRISTEYELGEAFFAPQGKVIVKDLLDSGIAHQNEDGSVIVNLEDYGYDTPILLQKSNGAALYATTDLATIIYREEHIHPERVIYSAGGEQQYHFAQLFALAKKMKIETELIHLWFGIIDQISDDGTREKMSSRKGVILMEELLDTAEEKAREVVKGRDVSESDIKTIALGAIKFSDFLADRRTNILFSWDSIFALSGFSGPYVQYAAVRVNKILRDNPIVLHDTSSYDYEAEKSVILKLLDYPAVVSLAARDIEPHKIASYLFELSKEMNRYYETTSIAVGDISEVEKTARLTLLQKVSHVFTHGLSILGIDVPTSM